MKFADIVQRFKRDSVSKRTVANHGDDFGVFPPGKFICGGKSHRGGKSGARMTGQKRIMFGFCGRLKTGEPAVLTDRVELPAPSGQNLVRVRLMADIPDNFEAPPSIQ